MHRRILLAALLSLAPALGVACASHRSPAAGQVEAFVRSEGSRSWLIVQNARGQEISAVRFDPDTGVEDFSTQRFFGFDADGLLGMTDRGYQNQIPPECAVAARLWQGEFARLLKNTSERRVLKRQSELLAVCLDLIGGEHSDGCTRVPDFDFRGCCVNHDICYQAGGSARDRLVCDQQLRRCIANAGHPILAQVYYAGVRAFGGSGFRTR
jgi:hypothetical protein